MTTAAKARNTRFQRMSKPDKRVAIARDVLAALKSERIKAKRGYYFRSKPTNIAEADPTCELQDVLAAKEAPLCEVCAIGACFYGAVHRFNNFKIPSWSNPAAGISWSDTAVDHARKFFGERQLRLMEAAFEKSIALGDFTLDDDDAAQAIRFGRRHKTAPDCLRAIMLNVVRNKGEFRP